MKFWTTYRIIRVTVPLAILAVGSLVLPFLNNGSETFTLTEPPPAEKEQIQTHLQSDQGCPRVLTQYPLKHQADKLLQPGKTFSRARMGSCTDDTEPETGSSIPLAFSFTVHTDPALLEMSLRMLYRARHSFCIALDAKADPLVTIAVEELVRCYQQRGNNVFLSSEKEDLFWGDHSILRADLNCMRAHLASGRDWRYHINMAGSEMVAYSVEEMERMLEDGLKGGSSVGSYDDQVIPSRYQYKHKLTSLNMIPMVTSEKNSPPPFGLKMYKGSKSIIINRTLTDFYVHNPVAKVLFNWTRDMMSPEESFFATLVRVQVDEQGTIHQDVTSSHAHFYPLCSRHAQWQSDPSSSKQPCFGGFKREVCTFSLFDIPRLRSDLGNNGCLIVNKFNLEVDARAPLCWVEMVMWKKNGIQ